MRNIRGLNLFLISILTLLGSSSVNATAALKPGQAISSANTVNIQPIVLSNTDGSNTATFFGNSAQQGIIEGLIDNIWAQADIDINFLSSNLWNNTFANVGTSSTNSVDFGKVTRDAANAGVTHANSSVINLFFVRKAVGFSVLSENSAAGLAYISGNGITQFVGSNLISSTNGQELIANIVSHEIGHNLGLQHINESGNLMTTGGKGNDLNASQINAALTSNFLDAAAVEANSVLVTTVPVPAAFWLFGSGLIGLVNIKKAKFNT